MNENFRESTIKILSKIIEVDIYAFIFLLPIYFIPWTVSLFELNKQIFLIINTFILLTLWTFKMLIQREISVRKSPFDLPLFLFLASFITSSIFSKHNTASLIGYSENLHWNLIEIISLYLLYYIISSNLQTKKEIKNIIYSLSSSVFIISTISLLSYFKIMNPAFMTEFPFNPTGYSPATLSILTIIVLLITFPLLKEKLFKKNSDASSQKENKILRKVFFLLFFFLPLILNLFLISPITSNIANKITSQNYPQENYLEFKASWNIAIDTFQIFPLTGGGLSTFSFYYNLFKPNYLNNTVNWQVSFSKPFNEYFLLLGETGIIGLASYIFLFIVSFTVFIKNLRKKENLYNQFLSGTLMSLFLLFAFTPSTTLTAFILFLVISLNAISLLEIKESENINIKLSLKRQDLNTNQKFLSQNVEILTITAFSLSLISTIFLSYFSIKFFIADSFYFKALKAYQENDGNQTYTYLKKSITYNSYNDQYHNALAQTTLLMASSLSQEENITDQMKENIEKLLTESTEEIKITTETLSPQNAYNWELRGQIYKELIDITENASSWSIASYEQAINLNPQNPIFRLEFGNLYMKLKDYDNAVNSYLSAINLKSDYAPAYYQLSHAYKEKGDNENAYIAMKELEKIIPEDNEDYQKIKTELEALEELLPKDESENTENDQ